MHVSTVLRCDNPVVFYKLNTKYITSSKNTTEFIVLYVGIKCQLDATEVFIADLIACSTCFGHHYAHHHELKSIIQWLLPVVFRAVVFQVAGLVWS
jgi:hypothetical protein